MANLSQTILITGVTGSNGIEILKLLAARNIYVRAMVRDIRKAHSIFQVQEDATGKAPRGFDTFAHNYAAMFG